MHRGSFVTKTKDFQNWCVANCRAGNLKSSLDVGSDKTHTTKNKNNKTKHERFPIGYHSIVNWSDQEGSDTTTQSKSLKSE